MPRCQLFLLAILFPLVHCADPIGNYCDGKNLATGDKVVLANAYYVLADLTKRTYLAGFAVSVYGTGNQTVYGLASCTGELSQRACQTCVSEAAKNINSACRGQADAAIWYDDCMIRYSTDEFLGSSSYNGFSLILSNVNNASQPERFDLAVKGVMSTLVTVATAPGNRRFASVKADLKGYPTIYGLAQCTLDLSPEMCRSCLWSAVDNYNSNCKFHLGCRIVSTGCVWRYEIFDFLSRSSD
ncbi:hypothetical protein HPP92_012195 [Vanilla planifolia]|uniref:Gnk2-homologous domain-containing protein n=1 Tax=Vanilla planifolia TaxID=51239 RepID=A0A835R822_VANPL|nr:hypothetical protein HPP92_012585 [Vanilla planifolia]KAG0484111.1 hypothetical protein HPP92_012195 [Vanilla planifolia]